MKKLIKDYTEKNLKNDLKWKNAIFAFTLYGIYVYFFMRKDAIFSINKSLDIIIIFVLTIGLLLGNIISFSMCYLLKLTSKIFHVGVSVKDVANVLTTAFKPQLLSVLLIFILITMNHYSATNLFEENQLIISVLLFIIYLTISIVSIISVIIEFYGLMLLQNLTFGKMVICFLSASLLLSPIYILLRHLIEN